MRLLRFTRNDPTLKASFCKEYVHLSGFTVIARLHHMAETKQSTYLKTKFRK